MRMRRASVIGGEARRGEARETQSHTQKIIAFIFHGQPELAGTWVIFVLKVIRRPIRKWAGNYETRFGTRCRFFKIIIKFRNNGFLVCFGVAGCCPSLWDLVSSLPTLLQTMSWHYTTLHYTVGEAWTGPQLASADHPAIRGSDSSTVTIRS